MSSKAGFRTPLSRARGLIEGVVTVDGRSQYTGVLIELLGTTYTATSGADGRWSLNVPVGTYGGVRASLPHYLPDEELTTISVNTVSPANVAPLLFDFAAAAAARWHRRHRRQGRRQLS